MGVRLAFLIAFREEDSMQLTCPACEYTHSGARQAWRLEVCPRCHAEGREVYLAESVERKGVRRRRPLTSLARAAARFSRPAA